MKKGNENKNTKNTSKKATQNTSKNNTSKKNASKVATKKTESIKRTRYEGVVSKGLCGSSAVEDFIKATYEKTIAEAMIKNKLYKGADNVKVINRYALCSNRKKIENIVDNKQVGIYHFTEVWLVDLLKNTRLAEVLYAPDNNNNVLTKDIEKALAGQDGYDNIYNGFGGDYSTLEKYSFKICDNIDNIKKTIQDGGVIDKKYLKEGAIKMYQL